MVRIPSLCVCPFEVGDELEREQLLEGGNGTPWQCKAMSFYFLISKPEALKNDYEVMPSEMIHVNPPTFEDIVQSVKQLEDEFNGKK